MMTNPWNIDEAFKPMFTDQIAIASNGNRQTLDVVIFVDSTADLMNSEMVDTDVEHIQIYCKNKDWAIVELMKIGDRIEVYSSGKHYAIDSVKMNNFEMGIVISARSI